MKFAHLLLFLVYSTIAFCQHIPQKGNLGVQLSPAPDNEFKAIFSIADVSEGSTAESLGMQPLDVLVQINGIPMDSNGRIPEVIGKFIAGQKVTAKVLRKGKLLKLKGEVRPVPPFKKANHRVELLEVPFQEGYVRAYLTTPKGEGPFPVVYYLQGYSCQSINAHPQSPVLQLTAGLVDLGYAVFRIEKPGVGDYVNLSPCQHYSFDDEVANFKNGLTFLKNQSLIDTSNIYLFGHSVGGNAASIVAQSNEVAGVMVYGTSVKRREDFLLDMAYYHQSYLEDPLEVVEKLEFLKLVNKKLYVDEEVPSLTRLEGSLLTKWHGYKNDGSVFGRKISYWQNFNSYNYLAEWSKVNVPVLAMYGTSDASAISGLDAELIAHTVNRYHEGNGTYMTIDGTNHLFAEVPSRMQDLENLNNGMAQQVAYTKFNSKIPILLDQWIKTEKEQSENETYKYASKLFPKSETGMSSMDVVAADVNNDGHTDLILATEFGPNKLFVSENGEWKSRELPELMKYSPPYLGEDSEDIAVADFDYDGDLDIFFVSEDTENHELLMNNGAGDFTFSDQQIKKKGQANAVMVFDFNDDGWEDILIGIRGQNELYINNKGQGFVEKTQDYWSTNTDHTQDLVLVDVDGDGDLDIVEGIEQGGNNLYINENGRFKEAIDRLPLSEDIETRKVVPADFDGDGDMDLYYCNVGWNPEKNSQNQLLENKGDGTFTNVSDRLPHDLATTLDAVFLDLNGDGNLDIITTNFVEDVRVKAFLGKNDGEDYTFVEDAKELPFITFFAGTSVLSFETNEETYLYFANFRSEDILLKKKD